MHWTEINTELLNKFRDGLAIPAHPLALTRTRNLDPVRQRALSRYYIDAGSGGLAVGVHTTQFAIRETGLYQPVLETAAQSAVDWTDKPLFLIAGVAGRTKQAITEAQIALALGYQAVLLSLAALDSSTEDELIDHCQSIADIMPVVGFYLQTAVGGRQLTRKFWKRFSQIENVICIKIAPFNRYRTLDVIRGVVEAKAEDRVTLYTGNDDHIVLDLVSQHRILRDGQSVDMKISGGLLGHWSVWTQRAVEILELCKKARGSSQISEEILRLDSAVTDCNSAIFDVLNDFQGVIAGCHEILMRQGLLEGRWCLDPDENLGPGQSKEIDRIYHEYPDLNDDEFVTKNLSRWLA